MIEQRTIGNNVKCLLMDHNIQKEDFQNFFDYTDWDYIRLIEGRLFISMTEAEKFAKYFNVTLGEILEEKPPEFYEKHNCFHSYPNTPKQKAYHQIMDLFDLVEDIDVTISKETL